MARVRPTDALSAALTALLDSPDWQQAEDTATRHWLILTAVCEALHPLGPCTLPDTRQLTRQLARAARDTKIRAAFRGNNYSALARRFGLTTRQVRRIIHGNPGHRCVAKKVTSPG